MAQRCNGTGGAGYGEDALHFLLQSSLNLRLRQRSEIGAKETLSNQAQSIMNLGPCTCAGLQGANAIFIAIIVTVKSTGFLCPCVSAILVLMQKLVPGKAVVMEAHDAAMAEDLTGLIGQWVEVGGAGGGLSINAVLLGSDIEGGWGGGGRGAARAGRAIGG